MISFRMTLLIFFFFQAEDGIRDIGVTGVQTCAPSDLPPAGSPADDPAPPPEGAAGGLVAGTRGLLAAFAGLTSLAVLALLVFSANARHAFAWGIHMELTAAFLGAAYAAGCVLSVLSLRRGTWREARIPVLTVAVFTALTLVATLIHAHKLHLADGGAIGRAAAWLWVAVYLVVPVACLAVVARQGDVAPARKVRRPMPRWLVWALGVQGAVLATAGTALFLGGLTVHHSATWITRFWPWELMPLSAQVIGAWLVALAVAAALVIRERDLARLLVPSVAYTVFGVLQLVVLVRHGGEVDAGDPWLAVYVAVLGAAVLTGGYGWRAARKI